MEIGGIKKKNRVVSIKLTQGDVENRIKSNDSPFVVARDSTTTKNSNSSSNLSNERSPLPVPSEKRLPTPRYPSCKNMPPPRHFQQPGRACEHYERFVAPKPTQHHKGKLTANQVNSGGKVREPRLKDVVSESPSHISYNREIIDHFEKGRYAHPHYNVNHLFPKQKPLKIDARYGD